MPDSLGPDDSELTASIHDFEAALSAKQVDLKLPALKSILAVIDGSNQTEMALGLAAELAKQEQAQLHVAYAYRGSAEVERDTFLEQQIATLKESGINAVRAHRKFEDSPPYEQITLLSEELDTDLLVVPAPYLEDFAELGSDSIGVNLDKLMTQSRPLLVTREPREDASESLKPILLPLTIHIEENPLACAWAIRLIKQGGTIQIVAVVDDNILDAAKELIGEHDVADLDLEHLAGLKRPETAGLIAEMHRQAKQHSFGCRVIVRQGDMVTRLMELAEEGQRFIVTGCDTDPSSSSYQHVQAIIRRARDPVLVV